jgi:dTDP-4-dehydrorhamnose 3,5-epimerase
MKVLETGIEGLKVIEPDVFDDERGYFVEAYNKERYAAHGITQVFVQDNESMSQKGVLRGLHWQTGSASQSKLVRVVRGAVYDVAVDLREGSSTYGKYYGVSLTGENKRQFLIPRGFAHGFMVLENDTVFSYKCDNVYCKDAERGIRFDDPELGIEWPDVGVEILLSEKDKGLPSFSTVQPENVSQ